MGTTQATHMDKIYNSKDLDYMDSQIMEKEKENRYKAFLN